MFRLSFQISAHSRSAFCLLTSAMLLHLLLKTTFAELWPIPLMHCHKSVLLPMNNLTDKLAQLITPKKSSNHVSLFSLSLFGE